MGGAAVIWAELTSRAIGAVRRETPVVLPIGAVEQHGPHLPVMTDAFLAERFARLVHERLPDRVLVLPTVAVGMSEHHMAFAGTLTVDHRVLLDHVGGVLESVARQEFHNLLVLNAHGGNQAIGLAAVERFGQRHPECAVAFASWWALAARELLEISDSGPGGVGHADELETSLLLHAAPALVDVAAIADPEPGLVPDWASGDMLRPSRAFLYRSADEWSDLGIFGRPASATAAKGAAAEAAIVDQLVHIVTTIGRGSDD